MARKQIGRHAPALMICGFSQATRSAEAQADLG